MSADLVVWNLDARYRPELEVEIEVIGAPARMARGTVASPIGTSALLKNVEIPFVDLDALLIDPWFCAVDAYVADDGSVMLAA